MSDTYQAITTLNKEGHSISLLCEVLDVSQSGYYSSLKQRESIRKARRKNIAEKVQIIFLQHKRRYGRIRIHRELIAQGVEVSEKMVGSIMKELGLKALKKMSYKPKTTISSTSEHPIEDLFKDQCFTQPNQCLVGDITYVDTKEGWLYLAGFMDTYSKVIKGYSIEDKMPTSLVTSALEKALMRFPQLEGAIIHSDRGSQYTSKAYGLMLRENKLRISMGEKANCYDNAQIESFWSTLKTECFPASGVFETKAAAKAAIFEYIEAYYNTRRRHSSINYLFPLAAEKAA